MIPNEVAKESPWSWIRYRNEIHELLEGIFDYLNDIDDDCGICHEGEYYNSLVRSLSYLCGCEDQWNDIIEPAWDRKE